MNHNKAMTKRTDLACGQPPWHYPVYDVIIGPLMTSEFLTLFMTS